MKLCLMPVASYLLEEMLQESSLIGMIRKKKMLLLHLTLCITHWNWYVFME